MKPAIRVENLSKQYRIGSRAAGGYRTLRESLTDAMAAPFRRLRGNGTKRNGPETFWALKDVSFEVQPGEVVGIIGRNGAGKSTLLKILSRIVEPTKGRAEVRGRIGSLLEVGTGFHPELTGRENIYLSGSILGMTHKEIYRKFDEIVAFSEIEQFLDTPVKRYSSGMYVRLAFGVAAHMQPEILLVDEVLAVGDLAFQQKCLKHMTALTKRGMTILLVSHNMAAIQSCCELGIFLDQGQLTAIGSPLEVIEEYRHAMHDKCATSESKGHSPTGIAIVGFEMFGENGKATREVQFGEAIRIRIDLYAERRVERPMINFGIKRGDGVLVCNFNNWYDRFDIDFIEGHCSLEGSLPPLRIVPDFFEIHVLVWPWGGHHATGDMTGFMPLAAKTCGHFRIVGPALNSGDGVFQTPAREWRFSRKDTSITFDVDPQESLSHVE